ncbi:Cache 3/Cache 2 fusion domain-containing protein [Clostridium hydrogenum]|uniref:Cache 3/Cache 2 fusion domain-containing protein n=1 Tax=Clostridium hydrogenum TaxID=2855764 RepID=UPI001F379AC8|nr:Cache 3/Cache 2 fusion domain-containing protein [Clostridium hydrogenum]
MKVKCKLIISYLCLIIFAVSVLGFLIAKKSYKEVFHEVNEKNERLTESIKTTLSVRNDLLIEKSYGDLNFADTISNNLKYLRVDYSKSIKVGQFNLPILYDGEQRLSLDDTLVERLKKSTGTIATIFLLYDNKLIRVSSTIFDGDKKVIGTYISSESDAYKKIINKQEYSGDITVRGTGYITRLKPLQDKNGKVIGAIGIGNKVISKYLDKTISSIRLGKTGYACVLDSEGNKVIYPYGKEKNVRCSEIVKKMRSNTSGIIEYTYKGVKKVGYYKYFEPWHLYVITMVNYEELASSYNSIIVTTIVTGLIIIAFAGIIAVFLANTLLKPISKLKTCMEIAEKGDLTVRCDVESNDEIGILAKSFNSMLAENSRLLEETVQYDKLKTEFIANMSHELRTPLNIIFSTVQLLNVLINKGENLNTDKVKNYTNGIKQNCYRLVRLVNNLIDITKIDSGFMTLDMKNENIVQVAEEITQSTVAYVEHMSRNIIFDTDEEEKIMAFDAEKLERILLNLISNAVKFTKPGDMISVTLHCENDKVTISVKDTGRGIPKEKISQLFQRFKQIDPLLNRSHEGSGIGLTIVKALVELHSGTIQVKSKYGEGTEFIISLPAKLVLENKEVRAKKDFKSQSNVENINIEFSDIYS